LLAIVGFLVRFRIGRPVLFKQLRPGLHGKPFLLYKLRSMTDAHDHFGKLLPDESRLTSFGTFLRATSLDELPELWNVLKGDMSFVGPRPLLLEYLPLYDSRQARRHDVKPGITGWAQINGRNAITWEEKFEFDLWYVENCSFLLDMRILWKTLGKLILREGITDTGKSTVARFTGGISDPQCPVRRE
jgi:lipopolysaccharide/colanic/teichoic acid biosynthesis glycosyltransferase